MTTQCFMLSSVASPRCFHVAKTYNFSSHLSFLPSGAELTLTIHMSLRLQYFIRNKFTTNSIWWFNLHIALSLLPNNNYSKLEFLTQLSKFCLNSVLIVPSGPHLWWLQHSSLHRVPPVPPITSHVTRLNICQQISHYLSLIFAKFQYFGETLRGNLWGVLTS